MSTETHFYKIAAVALSVALVTSLFPKPTWLPGVNIARAASPATIAESYTLPKSVSQTAIQTLQSAPPSWMPSKDLLADGLRTAGQTAPQLPAHVTGAAQVNDPGANPLSVSRTQSAHAPGDTAANTLTVTYTIHNTQLPATLPQVAAGADLTDTVTALQTFAEQRAQDANTIHNVLLVDSFTSGSSVADAVPHADRQVGEHAWNLGSIPPLGSITVTVKLTMPAPIAGPVNLDTGAQAWGTYQGRAVQAAACPVALAPDTVAGEPVAAYLQSAVDANKDDAYIVRRASGLCAPADAFTYVRGLDYEAYKGSLRGARGTEWSQAGNSLDLSNLLVALLRSNGIPARYRHGALSVSDAQTLILSMFPTTGPVVGYVPDGAEVSDPANDPQLLDEAQDHWWVEAYIDGAWTAMDPSFPQAIVGQTFTTPDEPPLAAVPDAMRHKVTLTLETEHYESITYLMDGFTYSKPLTYTFTTAELVGKPITFKQLLSTQRPPHYPASCAVFCWTHYNYAPYLRVGDSESIIMGHQYWELLSDFPFGQRVVTGAWLHFDVQDVAGNEQRFTREIGDRLNPAERLGDNRIRGLIPSLLTDEVLSRFNAQAPSLSHELDNYTIYFNPSWMAAEYAATAGDNLLAAAPRVLDTQAVASDLEAALNGEPLDISGRVSFAETADLVEDTTQAFNRMMGATYVTLSDGSSQDLGATGLVRAYPDSPRITIAALNIETTQTVSGTQYVTTQGLDLLHDSLRGIAYPGQAASAELVYQMTRGMNDTFLEKQVGEMLLEQPGQSAAGILQAAAEQAIPLLYVDADNLAALGDAAISDEARGRIWQAAEAGYGILAPKQMVDWQGEQAIAWWQVDPQTGEMVGVGEDGTHQFLVKFAAAAPILANMLLGVLVLVILLVVAFYPRIFAWQVSARLTWWHFWDQVAEKRAGGDNRPLAEIYGETLQETKAYIRSDEVWAEYRAACRTIHPSLSEADQASSCDSVR